MARSRPRRRPVLITRVQAATFSVEVNFSRQRPTTKAERRAILDVISAIVAAEKPAHTYALVIGMP